jgi:UDP-2,3-diacylglucosamine pyrophosphatase LpxH
MSQSVLVISDLHLGGAPGFQMCDEKARRRLAAFLGWAARQRSARQDVHLVINGDVVDFLAEREFASFTRSDEDALAKLRSIIANSQEVWPALKDFVRDGGALTLLPGNHDLELALPGPRRHLLKELGPGRVEFIYDNQALVLGTGQERVLIEHGNRYDAWNLVPHGLLRHVRAKLSRGEEPRHYPRVPGSELVVRVMNDLKRQYRFLDLLKPETHAALPLLAVLEPSLLKELEEAVRLFKGFWQFLRSRVPRFDRDGRPTNPEYTAARVRRPAPRERQVEAALDLARALAGAGGAEQVASFGALKPLWQIFRAVGAAKKARKDEETRRMQRQAVDRLYAALRHYFPALGSTFLTGHEEDVYLRPARSAARRGFKAVLFGHTHLVKRMPLEGGAHYLNTGTWANLLRVPDALFGKDETKAKQALHGFAEDLANNRLDGWLEHLPSFARLDWDDAGCLQGQDVYLFHENERVERVADGALPVLKHGTANQP